MVTSSDTKNNGQWIPPKQFGKYTLQEEIDGGGMGIIYKAQTTDTQQIVAIKFLMEQSQVKRFEREMDTGQFLNHRNFVRYHDTGEIDDHFYIVMDFIEGQPLKKYLEKHNLNSDMRLELFKTIVLAVSYAHNQGIIHRDLKPANILVDQEGEPVILDFGLAKYTKLRDKNVTALTMAGQILGTPGYMSPEQASGDIEKQDARSDVFSLGIILYEMLTARNPFRGDNFLEICYKIAHEEATPIEEVLPGIPGQISHICKRALARQKEGRYQTAVEFAMDIEKYLDSRKNINDYPTISYTQPTETYPHYESSENMPEIQEDSEFPSELPEVVSDSHYENPPSSTSQEMISSKSITRKIKTDRANKLDKIICIACGSMNKSNNIICSNCGRQIRIHSGNNPSNIPDIKVSMPETQQLPIVKKAKPVTRKFTQVPPGGQQIQNVRMRPGTQKMAVITPLGDVNATSPALLQSDKDLKAKRLKKPTIAHCIFGAIGLAFATYPLFLSLHIPFFGLIFDMLFGAISQALLVLGTGGAMLGGIIFSVAFSIAFVCKYILHLVPKVLLFSAVIYISAAFGLAFLLGFNLGILNQKRMAKIQKD